MCRTSDFRTFWLFYQGFQMDLHDLSLRKYFSDLIIYVVMWYVLWCYYSIDYTLFYTYWILHVYQILRNLDCDVLWCDIYCFKDLYPGSIHCFKPSTLTFIVICTVMFLLITGALWLWYCLCLFTIFTLQLYTWLYTGILLSGVLWCQLICDVLF